MINWIKLKRKEIKLKLTLFTYLETLLYNQKDIIEFIGKVYNATKDTPTDELQQALVSAIVNYANDQK